MRAGPQKPPNAKTTEQGGKPSQLRGTSKPKASLSGPTRAKHEPTNDPKPAKTTARTPPKKVPKMTPGGLLKGPIAAPLRFMHPPRPLGWPRKAGDCMRVGVQEPPRTRPYAPRAGWLLPPRAKSYCPGKHRKNLGKHWKTHRKPTKTHT